MDAKKIIEAVRCQRWTRDYKLGCDAVKMLCEDAAQAHTHAEIAPGVMASIIPKASLETREALVASARLATKRTAADLIADHFGYRVLRDEPWSSGDTMIHDGQISVVLRKVAPTSNA